VLRAPGRAKGHGPLDSIHPLALALTLSRPFRPVGKENGGRPWLPGSGRKKISPDGLVVRQAFIHFLGLTPAQTRTPEAWPLDSIIRSRWP